MPSPVQERYQNLVSHLRGYRDDMIEGLGHFKVFDHKKSSLWAQPLFSYRYSIDALPDDEQIQANLESLATGLNEVMLLD